MVYTQVGSKSCAGEASHRLDKEGDRMTSFAFQKIDLFIEHFGKLQQPQFR